MPIQKDQYTSEDLVYVDPDARLVMGLVEWSKAGNPKSMAVPPAPLKEEKDAKGERRRFSGRKYYPWGTYRSMRNIYRLEGKVKKEQPDRTLDQVMDKALKEAFWD